MDLPRSTSTLRQQQQPHRIMNRQQQQSGSYDFQPGQAQQGRSDKTGQMGEGRYEGARDNPNSIESYLKTADVKSDARSAKPSHTKEPAELKKADDQSALRAKAPSQ